MIHSLLCKGSDVRGGRIVERPDTNELVQLMRTKDAAVTRQVCETVTRQVCEAVGDDGNKEIQHLTVEQFVSP